MYSKLDEVEEEGVNKNSKVFHQKINRKHLTRASSATDSFKGTQSSFFS